MGITTTMAGSSLGGTNSPPRRSERESLRPQARRRISATDQHECAGGLTAGPSVVARSAARERPGPATHFPLAVMPLADSLTLRGVRRPPFSHTWTLALASPAERAVFVFFSLLYGLGPSSLGDKKNLNRTTLSLTADRLDTGANWRVLALRKEFAEMCIWVSYQSRVD